nr:ATP-binding protein [Desulfobaculum xiamenense]
MQHFHIDEQRLPPGSVVINRPESFYLKYKYHIWAAAGFTALQTAVILILLANIIRRRAAELRLRESEEKFRRIFENIRDGYFLTRMNGTLQLANKALADMFGYDSPETMQGIDVRESLYNSPRDRDRMLSRLMETGDLYGYEMTFRRKDGSVFLCDCNIHLLYDDAGTPFATEGLLRDVTERKLTEAMMVQNQKMMSLGGLAAGMAHEINNPLGAITQGAQNIMRRVSPGLSANEKAATDAGTSLEAVHDYLERRGVIRMIRGIQESGARAARIASDMLNFSRRSESEHAPHDIHAIIDDTLTLAANDYDLSKRYDFKKIEITTDYARDIPPVICSPSEIGQVFLNIFKNATQAMTAQHTGDAPRLSLGTKRNDGHVVITISDNGPGMDADTLTHLFDPFFTTKRMGEGTGLGMSVSRHIIENNHCGTIRATSAPGQGATFVITLPFGECLRKDDATAP